MNQKDFNLSILAELRKIAKEVFAKVSINKDGTYTAAELCNGKNSVGDYIYIDYHGTENEIYVAEIGTFKFQVSARSVFQTLWKFEAKNCHVKQADKARFTFGKPEGEYISEKAMFLGKEDKAATRKKELVKLSGKVAIEVDKRAKKYNLYYFAAGLWYLIAPRLDEYQYDKFRKRIEADKDCILNLLAKWDFSNECSLNPIYEALFEVLQAEAAMQ